MASFHGLRQKGDRPAGAGAIARSFTLLRAPLALAGMAAAFVLASQLAGSGGTTAAPELPSFLAQALGAPQNDAPLVRQTAPGVEVSIDRLGMRVSREKAALSLSSEDGGRARWRRFEHGVSRPTAFGRETITVEPGKAEHYLTVERRQGVRTWRWSIAAGKLSPRVTSEGAVDFLARDKVAGFRILPVAIYDVGGRDVTPAGLRWTLRRDGSAWSLQLRLDDARLPLPYVIDPATISLREKSSGSNGTGSTSLVLTKPLGVAANDFMLAQVTVRGGTGVAVTAPDATWTLHNTTDNGIGVEQSIYYKVAGSAEPASYTWTIAPTQRASGGIVAYYGVDNSSPIDASSMNSGTSQTTVTATGITTSAANHRVVGLFGIAKNGNFTAPGAMAEEYDAGSSSTQSMGADYTAAQGATGDQAATVPNAGGAQAWVAHLVALKLDVVNPTTSVSVSESPASADQHASGSTLYYRPAGLGGGFSVNSGAADGQSGLNKVTFPGLASGFLPVTALDDTTSPYTRAYTWTTSASLSGAQTLTAVDNATNSANGTFTVTPDSTAPTTTDDTAAIGSSWKNTNQTVTLSPSDGSGSGVATTYYTTDGSNPTTSSPQGTSVSLTSDGTYTIKYFSVDNVGNSEGVKTAGTQIRIDKTAPTSATLNALPSVIRNGQALSGSATDGGPSGVASLSYFYCAGPPCTPSTLIGSSSSGPSYSVTWSSQPADGDYQVLARATDNAGNTLDSTKRTVTIDNTNPNTTIDSSPPDPSNTAAPSFTLSSNETGASFECELDSGGFSSCTSPKSYSGLSAGSHTFRVRAIDPAGNVDATPASYTWTIDLTAPQTTIDSNPANPTNSANADFDFSASEGGSSFQCKLDGGSFASCTSPKSYTGLSAGSHTFEVRATDAAGNTDATPASFTWTIDLTAPQTTITASPPDPDNDADPSFSFTSNEGGSSFECKLDGGAFAGCASPKGYTGLAAGSHTFEVRATDSAGNTDATPASFTWTIDLTAPQTTIDSTPADPTNSADADFDFSASEGGSSFQCKLDGGSFASCTSTKSYTGLSEGNHTFEVRATDAAGNTDGTPASFTWTIDLTDPPAPTIDPPSPAEGSTTDDNVDLHFSDSEPGVTFTCALDGGAFASCTSPKSYSALSEGSHTFEVKAVDAAGNESATTSRTWNVDGEPETTITSSPSDPSNDPNPSFSFESSDAGSTFECKLDAGSFAVCTSPKSYTGLSEGSHTFEVKAIDPEDNSDPTPASFTWTIDLTDPNTTITASPPNPDNDADPSFSFTSPEGGSSFECKLDGGSFASCSSPKSYTGLAAGSHTFEVRATDAAGNTDATPASHTWTIDLTDPNTTIAASPSDPDNEADPSFSFTSSEGGSSFECKLDGGSFASCTSPKSYTGLAAGSHTFEVRATDAAGNTDVTPASHTWTIDLTAPQTAIDSAPADPSNSADAAFTFSASEPGSTFECKLDGGSFASCTSPKSSTGLAAGSHTFEVRATDAAGNTDGSPASFTWTIDLTDPQTTIDSAPADPTNSTDADFDFSASETGVTFECKLDGGSFASCTSPKSYTGLSLGSHTFEVRATDAAGNTDATPASHTWTIDLTDPNTTITASPSDPDNEANPSFSFTSSEGGSSFECKLDAGAFASCTSPKSYTGLAAGSHTFEVRATDAAGNTDATPASHTWTIDLTDPQTTITASPSDPDNDADPSFSFTSSEGGSSFECKLDAGAFASCTSPKSYTGLAAGSHTFEVRAIDAADNTDVTPASLTWTIDLTDPNTTITASPTDPDNDADPSFSFTSSEGGSSFECKLDAGAFASCTSPKSYTGLAAGPHTFEARATDSAGNTDSTPASHTWTIDLTDPNTTITASPSDPDNEADPSFSFTSSEGGSSFECKLDGGSFATCTSPKSYTGLAAGSHTFEVRATDAAGNTDATPASHTWTIDLIDPQTTITASPSDPDNDADPSFSFTSSEGGSSFECKLDAGAFASCTSPKSYTGLAAGSHTFEVRATDAAGNTDSTPASHTWTIDLTDPQTTIDSAPADPSNSADADFTFSASEPGSTFECKLDAGAFATCTSPKSYTGLAAGSHTFEVRATDAAGNTDASPATHTWTIDLGAPQTTIDSAPADPTNSIDADFDFSASEGGSTFECKLDGGAFASCTSPKSHTSLAGGSHTFEVRATDSAGNTDPTPASHTWTIDLTDPQTTITASPSDPDNDADPSFSFTSNEAGSSFECKLDGGSFATCTTPKSYTGLAAGSHTFEVRATDAAGNTDATPASHTWTIDLTAPTVSIDSAPSDPSGDATPTFDFSANEPGSTFECQLDGSGYSSCTSPQTYGPLTDGNHSFAVQATDAAGNTGAADLHDWLLDSGAPSITITAPSGFVNAGDADPYTITASTPDTDVTNVDFFRCDDASSDCAAGSWMLLGSDSTAPYSASWPVDADGNRALRAAATDVGTNTTVHIVNVTIDRTLPVTTIDSGPADPSSSANATFTFSASEGGTTLVCSLDGGSFAPCASPQGYTGLADGAHTFSVRATDAAGNVESLPPTFGWTIDAAAPGTAITVNPPNPSSSAAATFEFTSSEGGPSFRCELDGSGFSPCTSPQNYAGLADGSHTFRVRAVDGAGNLDPTPASYTWLVDATAPDGGLTDPGSPLRGGVTLSASPSDGGTGVRDVEFQYSPADAGTWVSVGIDNSAPYTASWDTAAAGDGLYDLRILVTDNALNSSASAPIEDRLVDNTAPSATMNDPGAVLLGTVSLTSSVDDGPAGSGVATVTYQRSPANAGTWTAVGSSWDTTGVADGLYDLRVVAADNAGNSQASAVIEDRRVDNTKPALTSSAPADGSTVDTALSVVLVASESLAGVANATIDGAAPPAPVVTANTVTYALPFVAGPHTLAGELEDLAGNRTPVRVHFTVLSAVDADGMTDFPYTEKNSSAAASSTLAASSGVAEATVPAGAWTGAPAGDWLVIRIDPRPLTGALGMGYAPGSDILDVTAYWAIAGTQVHDFAQPIDIRFSDAAANAVPAVLEGSTWRAIAPVAGTTLPGGEQDGFYRTGTDVHVLTRHLSSFALLQDVLKPSKPKSFRGSNSNRRLVLRWAAATDNSGVIASYGLYANGTKIKTVGGSTLSADVGRFKTTDTRKYQVRAYDPAGNASALTYKLVIVPTVKNLTLAEAKARLVKRGLRLGAVKRVYSSSVLAGRVVSTSKSGVLKTGSGIPLSVSLGSANRPAPSGSTGSGTTGSATGGSTPGASPSGGSTSPQSPPVPPAPPQPSPTSSNSGGEVEGDITTNFEATSQMDDSWHRRSLGFALIGAAFILAAGALLRSRQRRYEEAAAVAPVEPVLFWDSRLLQFASSAMRRLAGR